MELPNEAFRESVLIVAHPDDEVLWFSSLLDRVDKIVICFLDAGHSPELGEARKMSIQEHEYRSKIVLLDLAQSKSHNMSAWPEPEETEFGLRLTKDPWLERLYQDQAYRTKTALEPFVHHCDNVFTHNPWGEYGHEDHVQLNRIITRLAEESGANVWYDNYVSSKSSLLMQSYITGFGNTHYTMPVDRDRARQIADTYFRNDAWTFADDYTWFPSERFIQGPLERQQAPCAGTICPMNFIRVLFDPRTANSPPPGPLTRTRRKLRRLLVKPPQHPVDVAAD